jgi:hypothetical protein
MLLQEATSERKRPTGVKMGTSLRIFFIGDDSSLHRISRAQYERLINHDPVERLPQYAQRDVRCATVVLEMLDREPVEIIHIGYSIVRFDPSGRLDAAEDEKEMQLAQQYISSLHEEPLRAGIINAKARFIKRQYEYQFKWVPSPELEQTIIETVFMDHSRQA